MAKRLTIAQKSLAKAWLHVQDAFWREDALGKNESIAYDVDREFERACPKIREWARQVMGEEI